MLKLLGALLLVGGGGWMGWSAAGELKRRVRALEAWRDALALLQNELSFRLSAMPELMERLSHSCREPARGAFLRLKAGLDKLGERSFEELWDAALDAQAGGLSPEDADALRPLGSLLGRYGWEDQCRGLEQTRKTLKERIKQAREDLRRKGRAYGALGLALGAFVTIVLI